MIEPKKRRPVERREPLDSSLLQPKRQCTATSKRTGERCKRFLAPGQRTCVWHGSATRKSKTAAAKRIAEASGFAADLLVEFMADPGVDVKLRTTIAQDLLTRAGHSGRQQVDFHIDGEDWRDVMKNVLVDVGDPDDGDVIDAEVVEDEPSRKQPKQNRKALPPSETHRDEAMERAESSRIHTARMVRRRK